MAKKKSGKAAGKSGNTGKTAEAVKKTAEAVEETAEAVAEEAAELAEEAKPKKKAAADSEGKKSKKDAKKDAKKGNPVARWFKDLKMELSKVIWPKRETVVNNSIVVFAAMLGCAIFTWLLEQGFLKLFELAISGKS